MTWYFALKVQIRLLTFFIHKLMIYVQYFKKKYVQYFFLHFHQQLIRFFHMIECYHHQNFFKLCWTFFSCHYFPLMSLTHLNILQNLPLIRHIDKVELNYFFHNEARNFISVKFIICFMRSILIQKKKIHFLLIKGQVH